MSDVDVKKLLDPTGPAVQQTVHGTRIAGRVAVRVYWEDIENALRSGLSITAIYQLLHKAGKVSVTLQAFTRQVKARREGARGSEAAAKPATEPRPSPAVAAAGGTPSPEAVAPAGSERAETAQKPAIGPRPAPESAMASEAAKPNAPAQAGSARPKLPEIKPGIPHRPWRTGPRQAPDPTRVFKPRDPLADD